MAARLGRNVLAAGDELARGDRGWLGALLASVLAFLVAVIPISQIGSSTLRVWGVFIALGAIVVGLPSKRWALGLGSLVLAWWVAVLAARYAAGVVDLPPSVGKAVGGAAMFNTPYRPAQFGAVASVALIVLIAFAAARVTPIASRLPARAGAVERNAAASLLSRNAVVVWAGVALIALALLPDLRDYLRHAGDSVKYTWDAANLHVWRLFVDIGLVPMKDFFFPYGNQWLYGIRSFGPLIEWLAQVAMLVLAAWSLWRLSGGRTLRVLGCMLALLVLAPWSEGPRYLPALLIATTYAAVGPARHSRLVRGHIMLFAACLEAGFIEPDLLLYGLVGVVLVLVGEAMAGALSWRFRLARALAIDAIPIVAAIIAVVSVWLATGTAANNLRFFGDLTAVSAQSAPDEATFGPLALQVLHVNQDLLVAAIPALLTSAGLLWARYGRRDQSEVGSILLAAAGVSLVLLMKHFVRPIQPQMLELAVIALGWSAILLWRADSLLRAAFCGAAIAALIPIADRNFAAPPLHYLWNGLASPVRAARSIGVVFDGSARSRAFRDRLNPARFAGWPDTTIFAEFVTTVHPPPVPSFAIVGDAQMTYFLLRQRPPYETELYDAAPIPEQREMLRRLERSRPAYVIWREDFSWDGVPYWVRDPLIFTWMVANYEPVRLFGPVDVLRRRRAGELPASAFWRSRLAASEDLGYIPSLSAAGSARSCTGGPGCVQYALVTGSARNGVTVTFRVESGSDTYSVAMRTRASAHESLVRLDRLWFWPLLGSNPSLVSASPGFEVRRVGLRSGENLY